MTALLRYDAARQALSEARTFDEVRDWEDKAAAVREYARRAKNRDMEIDAAEIRVRAQRRRGELLAEMKASGVLIDGRPKKTVVDDRPFQRVTLADLDTTKDESSTAQKLAAIEPNAFESLAARVRERMANDDKLHAFDVLRERDGPVNGARSVMGSRQEPDDSLDYFPTPPWATRALFEHVFPRLGMTTIGDVWEPACGEGHIAEVAAEYAPSVLATDIHDYGYSLGPTRDFLADDEGAETRADLIITNPPFGDKAEAFVLKALQRSNTGVAMFFRMQWLETIGRYASIFEPHPPAIIAQFAERVPLHKGQWKPDGDTATAYLWIVWLPHRPEKRRTEFFWIPPGRREALTRADDVERFTAHPVAKVRHLPPHDPETGEIIETDGGMVAPSSEPIAATENIAGENAGANDAERHNPGGSHEVAPETSASKAPVEATATGEATPARDPVAARRLAEDDIGVPSFLARVSMSPAEREILKRISTENLDRAEQAFIVHLRSDASAFTLEKREKLAAIAEREGLVGEVAA